MLWPETHYFGLGTNGKELWIREYYDMLSGWGKMIAEGKSPFEDCYNNGGTDLIKLIESWGYFSENYLMWQRYLPYKIYDEINHKTTTLGDSYANKLEKRLLDETKKYFYYAGFYDLTDSENEGNIDFCEGYSYFDIYNTITISEVKNIKTFANMLAKSTEKNDDFENIIKTLENNHD